MGEDKQKEVSLQDSLLFFLLLESLLSAHFSSLRNRGQLAFRPMENTCFFRAHEMRETHLEEDSLPGRTTRKGFYMSDCSK